MASARAAPTGRPRLPHLCAHCSAFSHFCAQLFGFVLFLVLTTVAICSVQINLINYTSIYAADFDLSQILNTYDKQNCVPLFLLFSSFLYFVFSSSFLLYSSLLFPLLSMTFQLIFSRMRQTRHSTTPSTRYGCRDALRDSRLKCSCL